MNCHINESESRDVMSNRNLLQRQLRICRRLLYGIVALGIFLLIAYCGFHYRYHLLWIYKSSRNDLYNVQAIPDRSMPACSIPEAWQECDVGPVLLKLPEEVAGHRIVAQQGTLVDTVAFQHGSHAVVVTVYKNDCDLTSLLKIAGRLDPKLRQFTLPALRRECYATRADNFRWTMSPNEARWHLFCISTGELIRFYHGGYTESFTHEEIDGIVHFGEQGAVLDWQSEIGMQRGHIHFTDHSGKFDRTWVRTICNSLRLLGDESREASM